MKLTPSQIMETVRKNDYVAVMVPAKGEAYALSPAGIRSLNMDVEYDCEVAENGLELLIRQGKRKQI